MRYLLFVFVAAALLFAGCSESGTEETEGRLIVRLTDAPADYDQVLIDVQELWINVADDDTSWIELELETTGQIDLLELANGKDTLLCDEEIPAGKISQMRLVLGDNNRLVIGEETPELKTPSSQQSGLKFQINATLDAGIAYEMWIDFEAARSIVEKGNGQYSLKPVIRVYTEATSGAIKGVVSPLDAKPLIHAISVDDDTVSTIADELTGQFLISGLEEGTYGVHFEPTDNYIKQELQGIEVSIGNVTDLDTIKFQ